MRGNTLILAAGAGATPQPQTWPGGYGMFSAEATFGGGTVSLQTQSENGTWIAVGPDTTMTVAGVAGFWLPPNSPIRVAITTATVVYAYASLLGA